MIKRYYNNIKDKLISNKFWRNMLKNILIAITGQGGAAAINFATLLIITLVLGSHNYGIFVLAQSYMMVIDSLINFQSWQGVIKFGSDALERDNNKEFISIIKVSFIIDIVSAIIGGIIGIVLSPFIVNVLNWNKDVVILMIIFCVEIITHINGTPIAILRLNKRFHLVALHSVISALIRLLVIIVYLIFFKFNIYVFTIIYVFLDILKNISFLLIGIIVLRENIKLRDVIKSPLNLLDKRYYSYTIWSNLSATCDMPVKYFDVFFLSTISIDIVAVYKLFKQVLEVFSLIVNPVSQVIMPELAELIAKNQLRNAWNLVKKLRNIILSILIPIGLLGVIIAPIFIKSLLEPIYYKNYSIFILLLILNIFTLAYIAIHPYFSVLGFARESTLITLFSNICYVIITYLLIGRINVYAIILATSVQFILVVFLKKKIIKEYIKNKERNIGRSGVVI